MSRDPAVSARLWWRGGLALLLSWAVAGPGEARTTARPPPSAPVVVELFTAQGCGECASANGWASRLSGNSTAIVLTYPVDYWDYLGWKDTWAKPAFTHRQRLYRTRLGLRDVYTPQFVVDGRVAIAGTNLVAVARAVAAREPAPTGPEVTLDRSARRAVVSGGTIPQGGAEVWLIRFDPREQAVIVASGENKGAVMRGRNVVKELVRLGPWTGRSRIYELPPAAAPHHRSVVMVQGLRRQGVLGVGRN